MDLGDRDREILNIIYTSMLWIPFGQAFCFALYHEIEIDYARISYSEDCRIILSFLISYTCKVQKLSRRFITVLII